MPKRISDHMWTETLPVLEKEKYIIEQRKQFTSALHDHAFLELAYIIQGPVSHTLDGQTMVLQSGDYIIVDYGSLHSYNAITENGFENIDFLFLPELVDSVLKGSTSLRNVLEHYLLHFNMKILTQNPARMVFHDDDGEILKVLQKIQKEEQNRETGYGEMIRSYLIQILLLTVRRLDEAEFSSTGEDITSYLTAYVTEHYAQQITLKELAKKLNYSLPYVSKKFKDDMGISFVNYLQNHRVMQGCRLLASTSMTISQIAESVGYSDEKFFGSLVKRTTGYTPHAFRKLKK